MNRTLVALAVAALVSGCTTQPQEPNEQIQHSQYAPLLTSKEWIVEDIDGQGIIDSSRASLSFDSEGRVSGSTSCNRYFASYSLNGHRLEINQAATTMMACPEALMQQERRFLNALEAAQRIAIDPSGALILQGNGHRMLAR